jgi:hypothetical protein
MDQPEILISDVIIDPQQSMRFIVSQLLISYAAVNKKLPPFWGESQCSHGSTQIWQPVR